MPVVNQCNFMGHAGHPASLKTSKDGSKHWVEFSIAVPIGTMKDPKTMWINCLVFGSTVERAKELISKGDLVYVSGKLKAVAYNKKDGSAGLDMSMIVNEWQVLKPKGDEPRQPPQAQSIPQFDLDNDSIPF